MKVVKLTKKLEQIDLLQRASIWLLRGVIAMCQYNVQAHQSI